MDTDDNGYVSRASHALPAEDPASGCLPPEKVHPDVGVWRNMLAGDELAVALREEDPTLTEEKLDRVMRVLDRDGSGSISAAEFRLVLQPRICRNVCVCARACVFSSSTG
jgi:hypothetical protein